MSSKHIRSFSLTQANSRYLDGVTKGHRSDCVNRAIEHYRGTEGLNVPDLLKNIEALQKVITSKHEESDEITSSSQIADDETNHASPGGGIRAILLRMWPFRI